MIDRNEVLHVAALARLRLSEEEIEPMARELSAVLDHVAKIAELDLDGVPVTTHVAEVSGRLRPDIPVESLPREAVFAQAPVVSGTGLFASARGTVAIIGTGARPLNHFTLTYAPRGG